MRIDAAVQELQAHAIDGKGAEMAAYHKADRPYWGVANPVLEAAARKWRAELSPTERLDLAADLWATNAHEARVCAAKLMTQARIKPDDQAAWDLLQSWVPDFDAWAIADHVCSAGQRRLLADPERLSTVEGWTTSDHMWTKRAALVITLPWTKQRNPKPEELQARERILGWAASYVPDQTWFIQKAISWWLRELSRRDPARTRAFLAQHGDEMKNFAQKDAGRLLPKHPT